ncbi:BT_3928 family protein [Capnocytophaga sp. oral taxon 878]|uniref:BT_3928 family protein n=1 Tax=Capnocytophaga sp. oral taxon 878 TaxID=1316596 RepID=UPI000D0250E1|nr:BT_3928 family protein [Capnocytophaga sp. oral taxon 878]AVM48988.1 DoxX family protein [Capnocytophaga sp. oral taxon 878]
MKYIINFLRVLVGVTFIVSGLIKLNDPLGFSFKLEDYFAAEVLGMPFLVPFALVLAVVVCVFEVVLGVALLVGYKKNLTLWLLTLMMVFFGFLTFYSAYFNKVTDCGCFGDAIKFTPWQSFTKDVVLLALTLIVWWGKKYVHPITKGKLPVIIVVGSVLLCLGFSHYVYNHLPVVDFRPYKIGANIPEGLAQPMKNFTYHWTVKLDGKVQQITNSGQVPKDSKGEYAKDIIEVTTEAPAPLMHDFYIQDEFRADYLDEFMGDEKLLMVMMYRVDRANLEALKEIKKVTDKALKAGYTVIGLTSSLSEAQKVAKDYELNFDFYYNDATTLKTVIRSNPGLVVLSKGTILDKKHYNDADKLKIEN